LAPFTDLDVVVSVETKLESSYLTESLAKIAMDNKEDIRTPGKHLL
jgi:uncharacterized membrane protein